MTRASAWVLEWVAANCGVLLSFFFSAAAADVVDVDYDDDDDVTVFLKKDLYYPRRS